MPSQPSQPFRGLSAFPITPADAQGRVDDALLGRLLEHLCDAEVASIGLLGSTGIYAFLSLDERRRAVEAAVEAVGGRVPLLVGIGALRTDHAIELARHAETAGASALLLAPMSYTPLTEDEVFEHYRSVAGSSGLPLCVYNNPGTTHFTFSSELLARLAQLPTIQAVKMPLPAGETLEDAIPLLRERTGLAIGYSGDWGMADAMLAGADAFYSVLAGLLPRPVIALVEAAKRGDEETTRQLDHAFLPLWDCFKTYGSLRVMYVLLSRLGLGRFEPPRPILPLGTEARARVLAALDPVLNR
ncbi:dihydrodipicolinate synthase [Aureimonas ureilytica]|uniref:Dihydrodipicolinate synthase n=1 Tax=Aureimonas ureilytica TaxID=401562 RepID=A0A175RP28_9HYPH|nr:dihydrodipicolinate synthase family protein [Aureimonas ureilytica]KTR04612.1 dihydrodipicolinate synthase [Aureimonas ureilytica]